MFVCFGMLLVSGKKGAYKLHFTLSFDNLHVLYCSNDCLSLLSWNSFGCSWSDCSNGYFFDSVCHIYQKWFDWLWKLFDSYWSCFNGRWHNRYLLEKQMVLTWNECFGSYCFRHLFNFRHTTALRVKEELIFYWRLCLGCLLSLYRYCPDILVHFADIGSCIGFLI